MAKKEEVVVTTAKPFVFASQTFATLPTFSPILFSSVAKEKKEESIFDKVSSLFESKPTSNREREIDTGRHFDRFIVRENVDAGNPISNLLGGKFNERGKFYINKILLFNLEINYKVKIDLT